MTAPAAVRPFHHAAFEADTGGVPLGRASGTDLDRLAWLLEGAALLAHLDHAGWTLRDDGPDVWSRAWITSDGRLRIDPIACSRGRHAAYPQVLAADLLGSLFQTDGAIAGKGSGRRIARQLRELWSQGFIPVSADRVVAQILDHADFLWRPDYAEARRSLGAEHRRSGGEALWVVGSSGGRRRILDRAEDRETLFAILGGAEARDLWLGVGSARSGADPAELAARGRWSRAAALAIEHGPRRGSAALAPVRWLRLAGRAADALEALGRRSTVEALIQRLACQSDLGDDQAAKKTLHRLTGVELTTSQTVEVADRAIRLLAKTQRHDLIEGWRQRLLALADDAGSPSDMAISALVVAAEASWDLGELDAMATHLEAARARLDAEPDDRHHTLRSRWHQAESLRRPGDDAAVEHARLALAYGRRRAPKLRAARLWNELAVALWRVSDLAGAEKAMRHATRLFLSCQGNASRTLAVYNLATLRVRRGRLAGVEEAVTRSIADNRRAANRRALVYDFDLAARLELARGRYHAALARIGEAREIGESRYADDLAILEARARGWLGQRGRAQAALTDIDSTMAGSLEPEERPALWALADRPIDARSAAENTPWEPLWEALLDDQEPPSDAWRPLDDLEPYRAARVVLDVETMRPGVAPPDRIGRAITAFRRAGAYELAGRLEDRDGGPWRALRRFVDSQHPIDEALRSLAIEIGRDDLRCAWKPEDGTPLLLLGGTGGEAQSTASYEDGELTWSASVADPMLDALFAVLGRLLREDEQRLSDTVGSRPTPDEARGGPTGPSAIDAAGDGIIGRSEALLATLNRLDILAPGVIPIVISGESGTGKESAARRLHRKSGRSGRFVPVNCAAISDSLIQSELFGHVRGAFTGADKDRVGAFEAAMGGTLFLDEIGDLPAESQGMLLRVLQEGEVRRVGESVARKVDVRVVTATHRDLASMVQDGEFRHDLYYRLNGAVVELPPLRERGNDIELLARHVLRRTEATGLDPEALSALAAHPWPGNIRELENVLMVAARFAGGGPVGLDHLDLPAARDMASTSTPIDGSVSAVESAFRDAPIGDYHQLIEDFRRRLLTTALEQSDGNRAEAARRLGLTRQALSYFVRKLGLM